MPKSLESLVNLVVFVVVLIMFGCIRQSSPQTEWFSEPNIEISDEMATTVRVAWETSVSSSSKLLIGMEERDYPIEIKANSTDGFNHEVTIVALLPETDYHFCLKAMSKEEGNRYSTDFKFETGHLSVSADVIPWFNAEPPAVDSVENTLFAISFQGESHTGAVITDENGVIRHWSADTIPVPEDATVSVTRARFSDVESSTAVIVQCGFSPIPAKPAEDSYFQIVNTGPDGEVTDQIDLPGGHHDCLVHKDGTIAYIAYDTVDEHIGDKIVEVSPNGDSIVVWSIWDDFEHYSIEDNYDENQFGWSHSDYLQYVDGAYYVSVRHLDMIVKIDRESGELLWTLGGVDSDFELVGDGSWFVGQHGFDLTENGIVIFDNGRRQLISSRAVEYYMDLNRMEIRQTWEYYQVPTVYSAVLGNVDRLPDGSTLITWTQQGQMTLVSADGEVLWALSTDLGDGIGYSDLMWDSQLLSR